jgi:hypothetical protein
MRTTITLDPDVEQMLKNVIREQDVTFKEAVNDAIRAGLKGSTGKRPRFRQQTFSLGAGQAFRWDKALEMAAALEGEELIRKMALRK